jgi:hypothetical protein
MTKPRAVNSKQVLLHIDPLKPVQVYRNLHRDCLSVRQNGIVVCHADSIVLHDATFVVGEKGRDRVRHEQKKNVHAYVKGYVKSARDTDGLLPFEWDEIYYNPYTCDHFECDGQEVAAAEWVDLDGQPSNINPAIIAFNIRYKNVHEPAWS